ncbi:putative hydrolase [Martiniozyma asiatica (nom. inval.)]|nr:putative hydrolase [Martiniozyma asiatica]
MTSATILKQSICRKILKRTLHVERILNYDIYGLENSGYSHPPIIFLHGFLGNRKNNRSAGKLLSQKLDTPVIIPDLRNHGDSFHARPHNYKAMCEDLDILIKNLPLPLSGSVNGYTLIGHSMGGKLAMMYSLLNPDLIKSVVSVDNVPYANPKLSYYEFESFHIALKEIENCIEKNNSWDLTQLKNHLLKYVEPNTHIVDFYLTNVKHTRGSGLSAKVPLDVLRNSIEDILNWKLEIYGDMDKYANQSGTPPLLIINALKSHFVGEHPEREQVHKWFANYHEESIDASHWVITEKKAHFVTLVAHWLSCTKKTD